MIFKHLKPLEVIGIIGILVFFGLLLIPVVMALNTGYDYSADLTLSNDTGSIYNGRIIVDTFPNAMVDGGFIYQDDGEDIYSTGADICALGLSNAGTQPWCYYPGQIPAGDYNTVVYTGSNNAIRDQHWIAAGSDTCTVADHNDLDLQTEFLLEATITLFDTPGADTWKIIDKVPDSGSPTGYQLIVTGSPTLQAVFNAYSSGTSATVAVDLNINTEYNIRAFFTGSAAAIDNGYDTDTIAMSGTITTNSEDVEICELAGLCDDVHIRSN